MPNKQRIKGFNFEREIVNKAKEAGLNAQRAYGSNGKALGEHEEVDLKIEDIRVQAKRRKKLAEYLQIPDGCDVVAFKADRLPTYILITFEDYLELLTNKKKNNEMQSM